MKRSSRYIPYVYLSLSALLIGSSVTAGKLAVARMPVALSQCAALAAALLVLIPVALRKAGRDGTGLRSLLPDRRDLLVLALQALLGMFAFRMLMLYALKFASAAQIGMAVGLTPVCTAFLSALLLREKLSARTLSGLMLTVCGVLAVQAAAWIGGPDALTSASPSASGLRSAGIGFLLAFLAVLGESMLTVLRRSSGDRVSPLTGSVYVILFALLMFLPGALAESRDFDWTALGLPDAGLILYYGLFVTAAAYLLWFSGVSRTSASTAAVFSGFIPVSAVFLSCSLLREPFTVLHAAGTVLAMAGLLLVTFPIPIPSFLRKKFNPQDHFG